ncbi:hypothetical protein DFJ74DRAFT_700939 [Hyaloraphidium curvatum]|nr:hypothetical protein DFJ74DRAFT_700939 [Hyaloraphidium curvatum]
MESPNAGSASQSPCSLLDLPPEVLDLVCMFLPRRSNLELALTARNLAEVALRAVWRHLSDDAEAILALSASGSSLSCDYASYVSRVSFGHSVSGLDFANQKLPVVVSLLLRFTTLRSLHLRYVKLADGTVDRLFRGLASTSLGCLHFEGVELSPAASTSMTSTLIPLHVPDLEELRLTGLPYLADSVVSCVAGLVRLSKLHLGSANAWSVFTPETCRKLAFDALNHASRGPRLKSLGLYQFSNKKGILLPFLEAQGPTLEELVIEFRSSLLGNTIPPANEDDYVLQRPLLAFLKPGTKPKAPAKGPPVTTSLDTHIANLLFSVPSVFPPNLTKLSLAGLLTVDAKELMILQGGKQSAASIEPVSFPSVTQISLTPMFRIRSFATEPPHLFGLVSEDGVGFGPLFPNLVSASLSAMGRTRRSRLRDDDIARVLRGLPAGISSVSVGERGFSFGPESWAALGTLESLRDLSVPNCFHEPSPDRLPENVREKLRGLRPLRRFKIVGVANDFARALEESQEAEDGLGRVSVERTLVWPPNFVSNAISFSFSDCRNHK